eukprot:scaffold46080_cov33-Phaeocystis_antarctica.AAC.1
MRRWREMREMAIKTICWREICSCSCSSRAPGSRAAAAAAATSTTRCRTASMSDSTGRRSCRPRRCRSGRRLLLGRRRRPTSRRSSAG